MNRLNKALWRSSIFPLEDVSPLPLGVFRILVGTIGIVNALFLLPDIHTWYSENGLLPTEVLFPLWGTQAVNLFTWLGSDHVAVSAVFALLLVSALGVFLGLFTQVSTVLFCLALTSFHGRNPYIMHSGDSLFALMSFWLMFTPCDEALSIDRLIRIARGKSHPGRWEKISPVVINILQWQLCIVYFVTFYWKMMGPAWRDGTAVYIVSQIDQIRRFPLPAFYYTLTMSKILTWFTLLVEGMFPFLVWFKKTRFLAIGVIFLLHTSLEYTLNIQLFQFIIASVLVLFLEENEILGVGHWLKSKVRQAIHFISITTGPTLQSRLRREQLDHYR